MSRVRAYLHRHGRYPSYLVTLDGEFYGIDFSGGYTKLKSSSWRNFMRQVDASGLYRLIELEVPEVYLRD